MILSQPHGTYSFDGERMIDEERDYKRPEGLYRTVRTAKQEQLQWAKTKPIRF
jgi:hypothetical protein